MLAMVLLEASVQLTVDDVAALWRRHARTIFTKAEHRNAIVLWGLLLVMTAFMPAYLAGQPIEFAHFMVAGIAIAYLLWSNVSRFSKSNALKWCRTEQGREALAPFTVQVFDEAIAINHASVNAVWKWNAIRGIEGDGLRMFIMTRDSGEAIIIPRRSFANKGDFDHFAQIVRQNWSRSSHSERICPQCGYDLRAIETPGCPECGWRRP